MIAIIYEGRKTEPQLFKNIAQQFFKGQDFTEIALEAAYGGNLFDFYNSILLDEDMDIISQIQEHINKNFSKKQKEPFTDFLNKSRDDFEGVYLFFDFDLHHDLYNCQEKPPLSVEILKEKLDILKELLDYFNQESRHGKLYINYPMVESIKDLNLINSCATRCTENIANFNSYKNILNGAAQDFINVSKYTVYTWSHFAKHALQKANCIINGQYEMPTYDEFIETLTQNNLFQRQETMALEDSKSFIINSIPLFLIEHFGEKSWLEDGLLTYNDEQFNLINTNDCPNH